MVVIAGYLVWLRSRIQQPVSPVVSEEEVVTPSPEILASPTATPSATPGAKEATAPAKTKTSTPSSTAR